MASKLKDATLLRVVGSLWKLYPWWISAIVVLGTLSSLSEGIGMALLIPLLQNLDQKGHEFTPNGRLQTAFSRLSELAPPDKRLGFLISLIFAAIVIKSLLSYGNQFLLASVNARVGHQLRSRMFGQLLDVSYSFIERNEPGKLLNTVSVESWRTTEAFAALFALLVSVCTIPIFTALLVLISWKLTLVISISLAAVSFIVYLVTHRVKYSGEEVVSMHAKMVEHLRDAISGMRVIHAFGLQSYQRERFNRISKRVQAGLLRVYALSGAVQPLSEVLYAAVLAGILILALKTQESLAAVLAFVFLLYRLQPRVIAVDAARVNLLAQSSAVREVISLLNRADKPYVHSGGIPFKTLQQGISFDSVHFGYSNASAALRNVSFCIPQGKVTAIVGPSGAGKTTIIHLICRLYDAIDGNIYIDGVPLRELDLTSWRGRIALAGQDTYVFNTTVRENILVGRPEAASRDIQEAAIQANAHEFICSLPEGYDTKLGDRGLRLSGGQRQRIALARALLRDPEILLLDEATNALDIVSETAIQQTLKNSRPNRTIVIVAHRLSTVRNADQLVLLKNGTVVEQGHPQVLLEMNGVFAELSRLQRKS